MKAQQFFTLAIAAISLSQTAWAANWTGTTGKWNDSMNWDSGVPSENTSVGISNGGTAILDGTDPSNASAFAGGEMIIAGWSELGSGGTLNLLNGATLSIQSTRIGWGGGDGTVNVTGGSQLIVNGSLFMVGDGPTGFLNVTGAGSLVDITGPMNYLNIGFNGNGTLILADGGIFRAAAGNILSLKGNLNQVGTLNIGSGAGSSAGILDVDAISINGDGSASAVINFNHSDSSYAFRTTVNENLDYMPTAKVAINQIGDGTTIMKATVSSNVEVNVSAGKLVLDGSELTNTNQSVINMSESVINVTGGTLSLKSSSHLNSSIASKATVNISNGAILEMQGHVGQEIAQVNIAESTGTIVFVTSDTNHLRIDQLNLNGNLLIDGWLGDYVLDGNAQAGSADFEIIVGTALSVVDLSKIDWTHGADVQLIETKQNADGTIVPVFQTIPEPSTYALALGVPVLAVAAVRRRRK